MSSVWLIFYSSDETSGSNGWTTSSSFLISSRTVEWLDGRSRDYWTRRVFSTDTEGN